MKRFLLTIAGSTLCFAAWSAENQTPAALPQKDSLSVNKPNGERVITLRRTPTPGAYTLSVGGFDFLLGGTPSLREGAVIYDTVLTQGGIRHRSTLYEYPAGQIDNNTVRVRTTRSGNFASHYDSVVIGPAGDTIFRRSITSETQKGPQQTTTFSASISGREVVRRSFGRCLCGCGKMDCRCGEEGCTDEKIEGRHKRRTFHTDFQFGFLVFDGRTDFMALNHGKSISFSVEFMSKTALDSERRIFFCVGLRPRWDNYVFRDDITLGRQGGKIVPVAVEHTSRYKKSKLGIFAADVPLTWEFRLARVIEFEAGVYGGIRLGDRTKVKFPKVKDRGYWNTSLWQAGAVASLKIKPLPFGIYANYSFTPLFEAGAGPRLQPYSIGISW